MEFKGSKEMNILESNEIGFGIGTDRNNIKLSVWGNDEEAKANALLISKAPEMLAMLQKDIEYLEELAMCIPSRFWTEEFRDKWNKEMHEKEYLIKQATEL